jgi:hypothetical protein
MEVGPVDFTLAQVRSDEALWFFSSEGSCSSRRAEEKKAVVQADQRTYFETGSQSDCATRAPRVRRRGKVTTRRVEEAGLEMARDLTAPWSMVCSTGSARKSVAGKPLRIWRKRRPET